MKDIRNSIERYLKLHKKGKVLNSSQLAKLKIALEKSAQEYYATGNLLCTDEEYDVLRKFYEGHKSAPELKLGQQELSPSKEKIKYEKGFLYSLENTNSPEEFYDWVISGKRKKLGKTEELLASFKADGCSAALTVSEDGTTITSIFSRGNEGQGEVYTKNFSKYLKLTSGVSKKFYGCTIKVEVVMTFRDFEKFAEAYKKDKGQAPSNPRNSVSGILSRDDGKYVEFLTLVPLGMTLKGKGFISKRKEQYSAYMFLKDYSSFSVLRLKHYKLSMNSKNEIYCKKLDMTLDELYSWVHAKREEDKLKFPIDGMVLEFNNLEIQKELGEKESGGQYIPYYAVALKFPYKSSITTLIDIEYDLAVSTSGRITPCAIFEPVNIDGKIFKRVSLSNFDRLNNEGFRKGEKVLLTIRGDVLGYIERFDLNNTSGELISLPEECPICQAPLEPDENETWLYCSNAECPSKKIGKVVNYLEKMDIKGIAVKTVAKMYALGYITDDPASLYKLDHGKLQNEKGFGKDSVRNILNALYERRLVYDYDLLGSFGWKGVGRTMMKEILKVFSYEEFKRIFKSRLPHEINDTFIKNVSGIGIKRANEITQGYLKDKDSIEDILKIGVKLKSIKEEFVSVPQDKDFKPLTIVVTGSLNRIPERKDLKQMLELKGHKLTSSVSGKTDYLIVGNSPGKNKIADAERLGTPIINEEEFFNIVGS